ncbi:MAG TPA: hypothetical protein VFZ53_22955 [Polyangiaceae bacterium]
MLARPWALLRSTRALLACLIVFLAFAPPASSAPLAPFVVAASVRAPARPPAARGVEVSRVAAAPPTESVRSRLAVRPHSPPVEPPPAVRRLYLELCSLLR